jgi:hypothetical protein
LSEEVSHLAIDFFGEVFQIAKLNRQLKAAERFLVLQYEEAALSCLLNPHRKKSIAIRLEAFGKLVFLKLIFVRSDF